MRNLSLGRRHLVNAYEVKAGIGVIAGKTVWYMPDVDLQAMPMSNFSMMMMMMMTDYVDLFWDKIGQTQDNSNKKNVANHCWITTPSDCVETSVRVVIMCCPGEISCASSISSYRFSFFIPNVVAWFRQDPLTWTSNTGTYEKILIFDQHLALSQKWCKMGP